jgi:hypothetical protein
MLQDCTRAKQYPGPIAGCGDVVAVTLLNGFKAKPLLVLTRKLTGLPLFMSLASSHPAGSGQVFYSSTLSPAIIDINSCARTGNSKRGMF